jgi:hypothetical protein
MMALHELVGMWKKAVTLSFWRYGNDPSKCVKKLGKHEQLS